jgi:hypothetical protein
MLKCCRATSCSSDPSRQQAAGSHYTHYMYYTHLNYIYNIYTQYRSLFLFLFLFLYVCLQLYTKVLVYI